MILTGLQCQSAAKLRPQGFPAPPDERAGRALRAIETGQLRDARGNIALLPCATRKQASWVKLLEGLLAAKEGRLPPAVLILREAARIAPLAVMEASQAPVPDDSPSSAEPCDCTYLRLAAWALEKIGWIHRRQDHPDLAYREHLCAYHVRNEHGSLEEVWESALSLGLCADQQGDYQTAGEWYRISLEAAGGAGDAPARRQAVVWSSLANSLTSAGRLDDAVNAARNAHQYWTLHDPAELGAARAAMNLGHTLLRQGESLYTSDRERARNAVREALDVLHSAREALLAFGQVAAADARWCGEQLDFASRLHDSIRLDSVPGPQ